MAIARQQDLPGMENRKLKDIHDAAFVYAEARDARQAATKPESEAKQTLITLLKKHKLEHYKANGVECILAPEKEKLTVRIRAGGDDGEAESANGDGMPTLPDEQKKAVRKVKAKKGKKVYR